TMTLVPGLWVPTTTYFKGSIVSNQNNNLWISRIHQNLGNQPENSLTWEPHFGPMTISAWDSTIAYFAGELVYTQVGDGTARVYLSRQNSNTDNPATATLWSSTVTYNIDDVVTQAGIPYRSLLGLNTNHVPPNATFWSTTIGGGTGSLKWLQIAGPEFPLGVGVTDADIIYPLGTGPLQQQTTRNVFRLPAGWLRKAPQDPKEGATSFLGSPGNAQYQDWLIENEYIVTRFSDPIMLR